MSQCEEAFHANINANLCLLKAKGHKIYFEEGMFKNRNEPGFENVGYSLLTIVDPLECKKSIPWPLINDKRLKNEFRINFVKFIKMINQKYPNAQIPEMTASNLQHPGGENFLRFMFRLSTFSLKIELERMMGSKELNTVCSQPNYSNIKTLEEVAVKSKIFKGVVHQMQQSTEQLSSFKTASTSKIQQLKSINKHLTNEIKTAETKLKNIIEQVHCFGGDIKKQLQDIEDENVISDWNLETEKKIKMLEIGSERLCSIEEVTTKSYQLIESVDRTQRDALFMDGHQLFIPPAVNELTDTPVMNSRGQVRLQSILKAGMAAVERLVPSSQPTPQLPLQASKLLTDFRQQQVSATQIAQNILDVCVQSKQAIDNHIPLIKAKMEAEEFPDYLHLLDDRPPLQFILEDSTIDSPKQKEKRMSLNTMSNVYKKKESKVVCSIRKRRSLSKYTFEQSPRQHSPNVRSMFKSRTSMVPRFGFRVPLTSVPHKTRIVPSTRPSESLPRTTVNATKENRTDKAIPACKRSIYGKLPSGMREQAGGDFLELPVNDSFTQLASTTSFSESSVNGGSQELLSQDVTQEVEEPRKKPRKSLLDIIDRYKKLKSSKDSTIPTT